MKFIFFLLVCLSITSADFAQHLLKERVIDDKTNEPLEFVSVYVNTTTIGTVTNAQGEFKLQLPAGKYEIIVSFTGYEPIIFPVDLGKPQPSYLFKLSSKSLALSEVTVTAIRDASWYTNLNVFKEQFLGKSIFGSQCKLLNPEVLIITFDPKTVVLQVKARDFLQIENPALGYKIKYLLQNFEYDGKTGYISYLGYPNYELMRGGSAKQNHWNKNRLQAYRGSSMHFVRTLREQNLEAEGFNIRHLYRVPNPNRPSEERIAAARDIMRQRALAGNDLVVTANDSIAEIISKAKLPKTFDMLDTTRVLYSEYLTTNGNEKQMAFKNFFNVVYTGEKEELAYVQQRSPFKPAKPSYQTSVIYLLDKAVLLEKTGQFNEPLGIIFEGYWSWEKLGDMLPLDYMPTKK